MLVKPKNSDFIAVSLFIYSAHSEIKCMKSEFQCVFYWYQFDLTYYHSIGGPNEISSLVWTQPVSE